MLAALFEMGSNNSSNENMASYEYLRACNKMFERGILSHEAVSATQDRVLQNIRDGVTFFLDWHKNVQQGKD